MPTPVAGGAVGAAALLRAVGDSLVLYDGSRLLHCADPLAEEPAWEEFGDLASERVVALTSCRDLNGHGVQLFAATTTSRLLSWTWPGASANDHAVTGANDHAVTGWYAWQPVDLEVQPAALASWSLAPGHQELVLGDTAGDLWARLRSDWDSWSAWTRIGVLREALALDALASPNGSVELYAVTTDGELKRKVRGSASSKAGSWSSVDVVAGWQQPALGVSCWSLPEEVENQAVLLATGELQQRWRRARSREWSPWLSTQPAPVTSEPVAVAGWGGADRRQAIAVLDSTGRLAVRPWAAEGGWRAWLPAVSIRSQLVTAALIATPSGTSSAAQTRSPSAGGTMPPASAETHAATLTAPAATRSAATAMPSAVTATPSGATTMPNGAPSQETANHHQAGDGDHRRALASPAPPDPTTDHRDHADTPQSDDSGARDGSGAEEITRAEEATVLFAGRELLPLLPGDPVQIGPFKLQRRIPGGQASTDKFVARDGRGYCFLKVLRPEASEEEVIAFRRESSIAQRVVDRQRLANFIDAHPGDDARPAYLALSYEQGRHLGEICEGRPLPSEELVVLARSLLEALVELRACRIAHLDIKPSNVIMRNGDYPVVVDYGSAVSAETVEVREAAFGTAGYAAPEFAGGRAVNPTTDTYSWAAVLVAAATGSAPAGDAEQRAAQIARLPEQLVELVSAALAEEPVNRPTLDAAVRQLTRTEALGQLGVGVRDRLPVDGLTMIARSAPSRISPRQLVRQLGELATWQYRVGAAAAAATGILLGFLVGVFLLQLLRSI